MLALVSEAEVSELPADPGELRAMLEDATAEHTGPLIGQSKAIDRVRTMIDKAAPGKATILVRGETGTGKELVARAIHTGSDRADGPLVVVHCGALPDTLLEAELFGHEKGAFTGADRQKKGRVELAQGGTLFLDEIGDVSVSVQVKLLRLLQEKSFERLGSTTPIDADVRFVAATHRNLEAMVKRGEFREDLFYRLNVVPVWVPPLRARRDDVKLLAAHFCREFAKDNGKVFSLDDGALEAISEQRWPGNVRQLQNFIERLVVLSSVERIGRADITRELSDGSPFVTEIPEAGSRVARLTLEGDVLRKRAVTIASQMTAPERTPGQVLPLEEQVRVAECKAIAEALKVAGNNRSKAARLLGVSRQTLYKKMREHDLMGDRG
jgi:two-component system response regulator AtoC